MKLGTASTTRPTGAGLTRPAPLFPVQRRHLDVLTDDIGIHQHARGAMPDPAHGYCTDDVARALLVDLLHAETIGWAAVERTAWRSLAFLVNAFDPASGRFRNLRDRAGAWLDGPGSEDAHGRALIALGEAIARAPDARFQRVAALTFERALPAAVRLRALRARSSAVVACARVVRSGMDGPAWHALRRLADQLVATFDDATSVTRDWPWPEPAATYENGLPPRALIVAGRTLGDRAMIARGLAVLDWLIEGQTAPDGRLMPAGNAGWWVRGRTPARFDQQPIEPAALMLAAEAALEVTGEERYADAMERAYGWYLGGNALGLRLADPSTGACHDGLRPTGLNPNRGAESTLMWQLALERIRRLRTQRGSLVRAALPSAPLYRVASAANASLASK